MKWKIGEIGCVWCFLEGLVRGGVRVVFGWCVCVYFVWLG